MCTMCNFNARKELPLNARSENYFLPNMNDISFLFQHFPNILQTDDFNLLIYYYITVLNCLRKRVFIINE